MYRKIFALSILLLASITQAEIDKNLLENANAGDPDAQNQLGEIYLKGKFVERNEIEAGKWLEKSANQGYLLGIFNYGEFLFMTQSDDENMKKGAAYIMRAAEGGLAKAQTQLGLLYGIQKRFDESVKWLNKAADQGEARAIDTLGKYYEIGTGVPKSLPKAIEYYSKAADLGHSSAQASLGTLYSTGKGIKADLTKAVELYKKSANQEDPEGQAQLGNMYRLGKGVDQNVNEGLRLIRLAVAENNYNAIRFLNGMYLNGQGVKKSPPIAYALLKTCGAACSSNSLIDLLIYSKQLNEKDILQGEEILKEMQSRKDILFVVDEFEKTL